MANETVIIIPPNGINFIQAPQIPEHSTHGNSSSQQECNPQQGPLKKFLKAVLKTLGCIISASISVSAERYLCSGRVKFSVGTTIPSGVMALISVILYIAELVVNQCQLDQYLPGAQAVLGLAKSVSTGIFILLLLFSLLQFCCIVVSTVYFGYQATCYNTDPNSMAFVPYQVSGNMVDSAGSNLSSSPDYNAVYSASKEE